MGIRVVWDQVAAIQIGPVGYGRIASLCDVNKGIGELVQCGRAMRFVRHGADADLLESGASAMRTIIGRGKETSFQRWSKTATPV